MRRLVIVLLLLLGAQFVEAQSTPKPLILPFQDPPSLSTWLLGQAYGNTTGAYNFGSQWYSAGQGLHFGLDFSAACGTPLVAMADGVIAHVDNLNFGSAPHNLIIRHDALNLTVLYGHLLERPQLTVGQSVSQGEFVGYSGDPDLTCESRPHLHLEIRSMDYRTTYNPVDYIDANWNSLALIGSFGDRFFQMDLYNARRWMSLDEQPNVSFGGARLNAYTATYPASSGEQAPDNPLLARNTLPIVETLPANLRLLEPTGCCWEYWWHATDPNLFFSIDGFNGQLAQVFAWDASSGNLLTAIRNAPPPNYSPDFTHTISSFPNGIQIQSDTGDAWIIETGGSIPALNTDNSRLVWIERGGASIPGEDAPTNSIYLSDANGENTRLLVSEAGISAMWLDTHRLMLSISERPYTKIDIYDVLNDSRYTLGRWYRPRGFSVSPSGNRLIFYLAMQSNPADNGVYWIDITEGAIPNKVDWFGAYRWRDADSLFFIPFTPTTNTHQLWYQDLLSGETRALTDTVQQPFSVMNGQWKVNADGTSILFRNGLDRNLWFIDIITGQG